jgi:retron-type reverse transcriptase
MIKSNSRISANDMNSKSLAGIKFKRLERMSIDILSGKFKITPARRVFIPKPGKSKLRSLEISSPCEKILQKAIKIVISSVFEEKFLGCNHGFRPGTGCRTVLKYLQLNIGNVSSYSWVVKGEIKECFDNILHETIIKGIRRKVDCPKTVFLIKRILNAGYVLDIDFKKYGRQAKIYRSNKRIPQGIVLSPLFSNIVFHELDNFIDFKLNSFL